MQRRVWIKQILIVGGGVLLLPACKEDEGASSVVLQNISITAKEENLLAEITETILPATDTPGAKALNLHQFVLKMFDDCYEKEDQKKIVTGLKGLNAYCTETKGSDFIELNKANKLKLLREVANNKSADTNAKFFLDQTRKWVVKGYETSQYVLTKLVPYELVPGRFDGCKKITKSV